MRCDSGEQYLRETPRTCARSRSRRIARGWRSGRSAGSGSPSKSGCRLLGGPLLNNLGWAYFDAGEHERALELFERALEVRKRDPENQDAIAFAEEAVQTARDALA